MSLFLLILIIVLLAWVVVAYNRLVRDRNRVETAWSDIDVQLKCRYDLVPKLVAAVEQYARYEQSTLKTLIEIRSRAGAVETIGEKGEVEAMLGSGLGKLIALAEAYPELKADRSFMQLQHDLTAVENQIQYARRFYNGAVRNLNTRIDSFPDLLIAGLFGFRRRLFFELDSSAASQPPEIFPS